MHLICFELFCHFFSNVGIGATSWKPAAVVMGELILGVKLNER